MNKAALRKIYLEKRSRLSAAEYQDRNQRLAAGFFSFFQLKPGQHVHSFLPVVHRHEPDTWPVIQRLQAQGITVVVSRSELKDNILTHYPLTEKTVLQANRWGIPEPAAEGEPFAVQAIDVVLVPLLAFDLQGHRVGYGKGYYDRFLAQCRPDVLKIGLSLEAAVPLIADADPQLDVRLNYCVTPGQVWTFPS